MAEAIHSFLLDFTPTHSKVIKGNDTRYFSGGEVVAYLLDKSILTKEKRAKEVAQKLLATRQILYLDTGIKDTRFDVSALYVLARDVREERNLMKLPYQSEGLTPIFNPYGQDGLELFGIDWITTRIILCMLSGFLLFRLVMADW
ncbi:hypothetical protein SARC_03871 [Sphaeroforma arctica JP610]|uniref:DEP domain-containing protein n=1 Tax=Sphaeroforma arctica JP610 TaxID=667725 RepID=A0A0L0G4X9_9EUKA|nr:hypothetical protein SARC_03871 [Sphaeroforma arctica JP610]KNC83881.1 hypothetical protein SARC_03871 [Sphaeroforma arctica JP610]|eukprot:XP_014157783.1 hypothetical protein SARC_03871 [Sphaeroforma arctica JP610]